MITLTDLAVEQFKSLFQQRDQMDCGLRLFVQGGGCAGLQYGLRYEDTVREGDSVLEVKGLRLYVDRFSARYLEGACIDYRQTAAGSGFQVDNPNAIALCACGNSFCIEASEEGKEPCGP